jgi:hypothetical protein
MLSKFSEAFLATHPSHRVVTREVQSIPHLDYDALDAGRTDQKLHTPEQQRAFALANELTDELVNADAIIISTPMYNWSLPSALKAWVDRVVNCRTFYQRTDTVAKIPVTFIVISGMAVSHHRTRLYCSFYFTFTCAGGPYHLVPKMMPDDHCRLACSLLAPPLFTPCRPALVTQFVKGLGANEEDLKFINMHSMREDAETSAWLTTADDNPYQLVHHS